MTKHSHMFHYPTLAMTQAITVNHIGDHRPLASGLVSQPWSHQLSAQSQGSALWLWAWMVCHSSCFRVLTSPGHSIWKQHQNGRIDGWVPRSILIDEYRLNIKMKWNRIYNYISISSACKISFISTNIHILSTGIPPSQTSSSFAMELWRSVFSKAFRSGSTSATLLLIILIFSWHG